MSHWRLIFTPPAHGSWNMAVDESILQHIYHGKALPTLRLYAWEPPCLSLGYAQPFSDVDVSGLRQHGWEVVRRPTGGRAILHTDELTYSVTAPVDEPRVSGTILESYNRLAGALLAALKDLNLSVEIKEHGPASALKIHNPVCFEVPSKYEITVGGKKLIGSAQARRKEGVLQHGSLPLIGDLTRICDALKFEDEARRATAAKRLLECAATVESALGRMVDWETAARAFVHAFEKQLDIQFEHGELSASELSLADELIGEKYGHASWTERV